MEVELLEPIEWNDVIVTPISLKCSTCGDATSLTLEQIVSS